MTEQAIPLPASKAFGEDERSVLLGYLTYHRTVLARKLDGVTDEQGRRAACPPSTLTLLGLVRHMTDVERWWFRRVLLADEVPGIFDDEAEWIVDDATVPEALAAFWAEIAVVDAHLTTAGMDDRMLGGPNAGQTTLRRTIVHMIEEYARHCGHADLLREAIDGATGD
ncbi:MAG: DinB family protein [Actinomycetia bacterium]|nr:DinB family protein [Actinomycetes bacterium]